MELIQFKSNEIEKIWPLVKKHVQSALDRNQNFRNHFDVKENCINGLEQLWVIVDNKDDVHGVRIATGHDLPLWVDKIKDFEDWAFKNCGCKKIEIYGRPGWSRMLKPLGYNFTHVQMDKFIGGLH